MLPLMFLLHAILMIFSFHYGSLMMRCRVSPCHMARCFSRAAYFRHAAFHVAFATFHFQDTLFTLSLPERRLLRSRLPLSIRLSQLRFRQRALRFATPFSPMAIITMFIFITLLPLVEMEILPQRKVAAWYTRCAAMPAFAAAAAR